MNFQAYLGHKFKNGINQRCSQDPNQYNIKNIAHYCFKKKCEKFKILHISKL